MKRRGQTKWKWNLVKCIDNKGKLWDFSFTKSHVFGQRFITWDGFKVCRHVLPFINYVNQSWDIKITSLKLKERKKKTFFVWKSIRSKMHFVAFFLVIWGLVFVQRKTWNNFGFIVSNTPMERVSISPFILVVITARQIIYFYFGYSERIMEGHTFNLSPISLI